MIGTHQSTPPSRRWQLCGRFVVSLSLAIAAGCGSTERPYPVTGTLSYEDGQPAIDLAGGVITFQPITSGKPGSSGTIDHSGHYALSSLTPRDGAFPGEYNVSVGPPLPSESDDGVPTPRPKLPARFQEPAKSGIRVIVEPKRNDIPLTIHRS